eukprot:gb/GECG01006364.1/.p1 GENE.gb/GECG01006364.1/~~gb/GECG01006364.1/.p1  ORF type:complete len:602 (+),score=69.41 gb/GECG01006364.1/:1-1806(+)
MKFGKTLRLLAKPQWLAEYIDYKSLKGIVKGRFPFLDPDEAYASDDSIAGDPKDKASIAATRRAKQMERKETPQQQAARFESRLKEQINKARNFYLTQIDRLQNLVKATETKIEESHPQGYDTPTTDNSTVFDVENAPGGTTAASCLDALEETTGITTPGGTTMSTDDQDGPPESHRTPLQQKLINLSEFIVGLRDFSSLNITAVQKITKKYDKHHGTHLRAQFEEMLKEDPLTDTSVIEAEEQKLEPLMRQSGHKVSRRSSLLENELLVSQPVVTVSKLDLNSLPAGKVTWLYVSLGESPLSQPLSVPVMVMKGSVAGPIVGITSALHGNELNGIPLIHRLFREVDVATLCGIIVAVPVVNIHGYTRYQRGFSDGVDLNRIMPGKKHGTGSQKFAYHLCTRILHCFEYLLDMHTASFGRVNSLYVRADMNDPIVGRLAKLCIPQIIVHNTGPDGSLRGAAAAMGINAVTIEIGNPQRFHQAFIERAYKGVLNVLSYLNMIGHPVQETPGDPVVCSRSHWMFTRTGGVLYVMHPVNTWVRNGEIIAEIRNIFGKLVDRYVAPNDGIVVGKSDNPVAQTGDRILHLGIVGETFPRHVDDGHM